jgi:hypothetical protein
MLARADATGKTAAKSIPAARHARIVRRPGDDASNA